MNGPGRARGRRAPADRPGPALVFADREELDQAEQTEGGADETVFRRLLETQVVEERLRVGGVERGDLLFDLGGDGAQRHPGSRGDLLKPVLLDEAGHLRRV